MRSRVEGRLRVGTGRVSFGESAAARLGLLREQLAQVLLSVLGPIDAETLAAFERRVQWVTLPSGDWLFRKGDPGEHFYVVLVGRLVVIDSDEQGREHVLRELGRGEALGEIALLTGEPRSASVCALRDTTMARLDVATFHEMTARIPGLLRSITRTLSRRMIRVDTLLAGRAAGRSDLAVALLPVRAGRPIAEFARRLLDALAAHGPTLHVSAARLAQLGIVRDGDLPDEHADWLRFSSWLEAESARHRFVVMEADPGPSRWSERAVRQADRVLLVGDAGDDPAPGATEALLDRLASTSRRRPRTLLLLHPDGSRQPHGTARWLAPRSVESHLHVRLDRTSDLDRLARTLAGRASALVLSGGGVRGWAHGGVMRALGEAGRSIDHVGGTSAGAMIGSQAANEQSHEAILDASRRFRARRPFSAYAIPIFSLLRGEPFARAIEDFTGAIDIEDLWRPFFCVACSLTTSGPVVLDRGPLWRALRASASLPAVFEPVLHGGQLLIDGGLLDNLPVGIMRTRHGGRVLAVDVSSQSAPRLPPGSAAYPSAWSALAARLRFWRRRRVEAPRIAELLVSAMSLSAEAHARAGRSDADRCWRPPVSQYSMLDFDRMEEIIETGYQFARGRLEAGDWPTQAE